MAEGRNLLDVAMELTNLHVDKIGISDPKEIEELYVKFYATAKVIGTTNEYNLKKYVPNEILENIE